MKRRDFIKSVDTIATLAPIASHKAIADLTHNSNTTERNNKMKKVIVFIVKSKSK